MSINWGDLDVRVFAAQSWFSIAARFALDDLTIVDRLETLIADPSPAVRLQVAENLQILSEVTPDRMWAMGLRIAAHDPEPRVVTDYLNDSLVQFSSVELQRCEEIVGIVNLRIDDGFDLEGQDGHALRQGVGSFAAQLVLQGSLVAGNWLSSWVAEPERYEQLLRAFVLSLRSPLFARYMDSDNPDSIAPCERAQGALSLILSTLQPASHEARQICMSNAGEAERQASALRYASAENIIIIASAQLFFGSGAHGPIGHAPPGLPNDAAKRRFLADYADILSTIGRSHEPMALHHLVELYEFLIAARPTQVFDALCAVLLGRGNEEGYHAESLANTSVVRIIRRYVADHRAVFEDTARRAKLTEILRLFSSVGWSDALELLYDLPDLLR